MNKIVEKKQLSESVFKFVVEAPLIAESRKPGNFVILRTGKTGERIPLTIVDSDTSEGTITLIVQNIGLSSGKLCKLEQGQYITDMVGPLGKATDIHNVGTILAAGGGVGIAPLYPIVEAYKKAGNRVITVLAARSKELLILEDEMRQYSDELIIMTDDGSYGTKGLVTDGMRNIIESEKVDECVAIGPAIMMKFVAALTKEYSIPTQVSLNSLMVDGTGMCGACRVTVDGQRKFTCVDGPEFDAHKVDFNELIQRLQAYKQQEQDDLDFGETACVAKETYRDDEWRKKLREQMSAAERTKIERVKMPETAPETRIKSQTVEVNLGLSEGQAIKEAQRCLDCPNPTCIEGCPVLIDIPGFVKHIENKNYVAAAQTLKKYSALPGVCGRVCPQEKQCEEKCIYTTKLKKEPVAIGYLERFAADMEMKSGTTAAIEKVPSNSIKVAAIGSGPSSLSFAGDMIKAGYDVTVFEALHEIGGVLRYGIPEFRLPNEVVDEEVRNLEKLGVKFETNIIIGKTISFEKLKEQGFKAFFIGSGAGLPNFMDIPGENLNGVMSANEYLTRVNLMAANKAESDTPVLRGKTVAVIGGGNTAMDAVRTSKRLGAQRSIIIYRRTREEMPARVEEVKHALEEGVEFYNLASPIEYHGNEKGQVTAVKLQKMKLGEPDSSGRRRPVPIDGDVETIDINLAIVAIGVSPNPLIPACLPELEVGWKNTLKVNEDTMETSMPGFFAGGDIVRGGATVILAMGDGRKAAMSMQNYLSKNS